MNARLRLAQLGAAAGLLALLAVACGEPAGASSDEGTGGGAGSNAADSGDSGSGGRDSGGGSANSGGRAGTGGRGGQGLGGEQLGGSSGDPDPTEGSGGGGGEDECEYLYDEGHGDLFITLDGGLGLRIRSAFGAGSAEILVEPSRVCVVVPPASYALTESMGGAPDSEAYAFLGVPPGEPFWLLPQTPRIGMPWFGASTEGVLHGVYDRDEVELVLEAVNGPDGAHVSVWSTDTFGAPSPLLSTALGRLTHVFSTGAHVHFNWAFSAAGTYLLSFRIRGERNGTEEESQPTPLRFLVEP